MRRPVPAAHPTAAGLSPLSHLLSRHTSSPQLNMNPNSMLYTTSKLGLSLSRLDDDAPGRRQCVARESDHLTVSALYIICVQCVVYLTGTVSTVKLEHILASFRIYTL